MAVRCRFQRRRKAATETRTPRPKRQNRHGEKQPPDKRTKQTPNAATPATTTTADTTNDRRNPKTQKDDHTTETATAATTNDQNARAAKPNKKDGRYGKKETPKDDPQTTGHNRPETKTTKTDKITWQSLLRFYIIIIERFDVGCAVSPTLACQGRVSAALRA